MILNRKRKLKGTKFNSTDEEINKNFALSRSFYARFFSPLMPILKNQLDVHVENNFNLFQFEIYHCILNNKCLHALQMLKKAKFSKFNDYERLKCYLEYLSLKNLDLADDHYAIFTKFMVQIVKLLSSDSLILILEQNEQNIQSNEINLDYFESSDEQILFFSPTLTNVISILVHNLITFFEDTAKPVLPDALVGHIIVLSQFKWPRFRPAFQRMIKLIRRNFKFSYPFFVDSIFLPEILEEFQELLIEIPSFPLRLEKDTPNKAQNNGHLVELLINLLNIHRDCSKTAKETTHFMVDFIRSIIKSNVERLAIPPRTIFG